MTVRLRDDQLSERLRRTLRAVADSIPDGEVSGDVSDRPERSSATAPRRAPRLALPAAIALAGVAVPVAAAAWVGWQPDWSDDPGVPRPLEVVPVAGQEVWLVSSDRPGEDVRILSDGAPGDDAHGAGQGDAWTELALGRHPSAPPGEVDWGAVMLDDHAGRGDEPDLVLYVVSAPGVDQLRIRIDGTARTVPSHPVDNGSYAIFSLPGDAARLSLHPLTGGRPVPGARLAIDVPRP